MMPEEISIEECIKHGIESIVDLIVIGPFCGDLVRYISEDLKKNYPYIEGRSDRIARSLYWAFTNRPNPLIESFFWIHYSCDPSVSLVSHKYVKKGEIYKTEILKKILDEYSFYILS